MEEQKVYLKSMVDYISDQKEKVDISNYFMDTQNYSSFLKQELNISMFVPAILKDGKWVVLKEPKDYKNWIKAVKFDDFNYFADGWYGCREYQEAKENVLFKGFSVEQHEENSFSIRCENNILNVMWNFSDERKWFPARGIYSIEDLIRFNLELTPSAIKQLNL